MGFQTGASFDSTCSYGLGHGYGSSSYGTSAHSPIDLTGDTPPRQRARKRKSDYDHHGHEDDEPVRKQKRADEERRLKRFRAKAPRSFFDIQHRALSQRFYVLDRQQHPPSQPDDCLLPFTTETVKLAGTTGNVYTITIDRIPTCDCPHAQKGNQCKHVVYVLARVLRAKEEFQYQLAFTSSELVEVFARAPALPSEKSASIDEAEQDGKRKRIEGECPICCMDFEPEAKEKIVWCKAACGQNIHKECFDQWARTKKPVTCPYCRSPWESDAGDITGRNMKDVARHGRVNAEGYMNVASQLGISRRRDYSTYNEYWVRSQGYRY